MRVILDEAGLDHLEILLSGDLEEHRIADLIAAEVPADAFGVGTQLGTSGDAPSLGAAYKLVEDVRGPKIKLSTGKVTMPGRKQVHRLGAGEEARDLISLQEEVVPGGRPLLEAVMSGGKRLGPAPTSAGRATAARPRSQPCPRGSVPWALPPTPTRWTSPSTFRL